MVAGEAAAAVPAGAVDLNTASQADLEKIPGIGPVTADRIILYRESKGLFVTLDELKHVRGIGEKTFLKIAPYLKIN
ncbi:helix-hairpin-helix domain-containing protein [bacterium]|nr:helix-hairpin-helix domain-containing protein [bacterium]